MCVFRWKIRALSHIINPMNNEQLVFEDIKQAVYRKGKYGILTFFVTLIIAILYILFKTPVYESEIRVRLPGATSVTEMVLAGATTPWNDVPTQLELIKSKAILKKVCDRLSLRFMPLDKEITQIIKREDLNITDSFPSGKYTLKLSEQGFTILDQRNIVVLSGSYDTLVSDNRISLNIEKPNPKYVGNSYKFEVLSLNSAIKNLMKNVRVVREGQSFVAVIKARSTDPILAKRLAEEVANGYYEFTLEDVRFQATSLRQFLEEQIKKVEDELTSYENNLAQVKQKLGTFSYFALENVSESIKDIFSKMNQLEFERANLQIRKSELAKEIETIRSQLEGKGYLKEYAKIATNLETSGDPRFASLQSKLYDLELQRALLLEKYNEENPEIKAIDSQIEKVKERIRKAQEDSTGLMLSSADPLLQQLAQRIVSDQAEILILSAKESALDSALARYESKISNLPENALMYSKIKRKIQALSSVYNVLLERLEQTKVEEASKISDVRIIDFAMIPTSPVIPKKFQTILISIILGTALGFLITVTAYYLDNTVKFSSEVENIIGRPCIGKVPVFQKEEGEVYPLVVHKDPLSPEAEAFKKLKFNIEILVPSFPKMIAVSSVLEDEGKSTIASNLAIIYAMSGVRTLIVDGDLRKPVHHKIFNVPNDAGFTELITKGILKPHPTSFPNLFVLPAGTNSLNVLRILDAFDLKRAYELITENFDIAIIDTPPILPVAETFTLASFTKNLILVVKTNSTPKTILSEIVPTIPEKVNLIGFLMNFYERAEGYYKYYRYHYGKKEETMVKNSFLKKWISK